jgi:diguanylate cyclase (GGDEF)-like protein/PAS domain S-box-containing protein
MGWACVSLRANTYVALTGAAFLAILLVFTATLYAGRVWVHSAERVGAAGSMSQAQREVVAELKSIDSVTRDWGSWSDALHFVQGTNSRFVTDNQPSSVLSQADVDALVMVDTTGKVKLEELSSSLGADPEARRALIAAVGPGGQLLLPASGSAHVGISGILTGGKAALLVAARPIVSSSESGPVGGTVVLARLIDASLIARLSSVSGVDLHAYVPSDRALDPAVRSAVLALPPSNPIYISVIRPLDISAYLRLDAIDGKPALVLASAIKPVDYEIAMRTLGALITAFLLGGLLWAIVSYQVVDSASLARMAWLRDAVASITHSGSFSQRIALEQGAGDEVSSLGYEVNEMLDALDRLVQRVQESEAQRRVLVDNMADAVFTCDAAGRFSFGNPQAERLTGIPAAELVGRPCTSVLAEQSVAAVEERLRQPGSVPWRPLSVVVVARDGSECPVELSIAPIRGQDGEFLATTWIARDVTERREFEDRLMYLADHDDLTGLFNRRRFEEAIREHLDETRRLGEGGALVWFDLDRFKEINDTFGHGVGDDVLVRVSGILRERSRQGHVLARLGGDEFAMLLPGAGAHEALAATERILVELSDLVVSADGRTVNLSASAGVAFYPADSSTADELLRHADIAMYRAKESGRGVVKVYRGSDGERAKRGTETS